MTGHMINEMVELISYNKVAVIREKDKTKWKESNQNIGPLVSNISKYLPNYLGWDLAGDIK